MAHEFNRPAAHECDDPICQAFDRGWHAGVKWAREHPDTRIARLRNWWRARPIRGGWRYSAIYRQYRQGWKLPKSGVHPGYGPLRSALYALAFPHTHSEDER